MLTTVLTKNSTWEERRCPADRGYISKNWPGYKTIKALDRRYIQKIVITVDYKEDSGLLPVEIVEYLTPRDIA